MQVETTKKINVKKLERRTHKTHTKNELQSIKILRQFKEKLERRKLKTHNQTNRIF